MPENDKFCRMAAVSDEFQDLIISYSGRPELLTELNLDCYQNIDDNFAVAYYYRPMEALTDVVGSYSEMPKCCGLLQLQNLEEIGVSRLRRIEGFELYGQGILIGMVDTGIAYSHPAFLQADGSSRVVAIWDQGNQEGQPPEGFLFGTEYGSAEIAAGTAPGDEIGHGTFLAGIAAGRMDADENFSGVAPLAELAVVKLKQAKEYLRRYYLLPEGVPAYSEADIMLGVKYLIELARRRGQPLVLFLGLGTSSGSHTGTLPLCRYLDALSFRLNLCLIVSAGNEGNARHHYRGTGNGDIQELELQIGKGRKGFTMEYWTSAISRSRLTLISPSGERAEINPDVGGYEQRRIFIFDRTIVLIRFEQQERASGRRLIQMRFLNPPEGLWRIQVDARQDTNQVYDLWLPMSAFLDEGTFFLQPDPEVTLCEPGNAALLITVGGYSAMTGGSYPPSSRGFTASGQDQPGLVAPAGNVVGPYAAGGYVTGSGTSIAAAYTAGCTALFFEYFNSYYGTDSHPGISEQFGEGLFLDTLVMKSLLTQGATREADRSYPNPESGYGKLNLYGIFEILRNV